MAEDKKQLARAVSVDGTWYQPGDDLPAEVAEKITNPKAWTSYEDAAEAEADKVRGKQGGTDDGTRLARTVHVDGNAYGPYDYVPADVAEKITNPKAWDGGELPGADKAKATAPTGSARTDQPAAAEDTAGREAKARKSAAPTKRA